MVQQVPTMTQQQQVPTMMQQVLTVRMIEQQETRPPLVTLLILLLYHDQVVG